MENIYCITLYTEETNLAKSCRNFSPCNSKLALTSEILEKALPKIFTINKVICFVFTLPLTQLYIIVMHSTICYVRT